MTDKPTQEPKPCPLCNDPMQVTASGILLHKDSDGPCLLASISWAINPARIAAWNQRSGDATELRDLAEQALHVCLGHATKQDITRAVKRLRVMASAHLEGEA